MNRSHRLLLLLFAGLGPVILAPVTRAQDAAGEDDEKRVQYQLVLPDEKTPENVKPEEHNPFESESEAQDRMSPGDTEENRVRDLLLRLKVTGTKKMEDGRMQVLLGNIILETGKAVPAVLPDQQVVLKVKNISAQSIELAWQEKRATGLPPKLMIIPISTSPRVRYQMLGQIGEDGKDAKSGVNATMDMPLRSLTAKESQPQAAPVVSAPPAPPQEPQPLPAELVLDDPPVPAKALPVEPGPAPALAPDPAPALVAMPAATPVEDPAPDTAPPPAITEEMKVELAEQPVPVAPMPPPLEPPPAAAPAPASSTPPPSPAIESMVRMLFGNPTPAPAPKTAPK